MSVGLVFSAVVGQLPLLAVLVTGFILLTTRRDHLSRRSVLLARLGLGALVITIVLQTLWTVAIPSFYRLVDNSLLRYSTIFSLIGLFISLVSAAGIGLLIAAVVTRGPGQSPAAQSPPGSGHPGQGVPGLNFQGQAAPGQGLSGQAAPGQGLSGQVALGQAYGGQPHMGRPYDAQPVGRDPGGPPPADG